MSQQENAPRLDIIQQYIKDLSFENIMNIAQLVQQGIEPTINSDFSVNASKADGEQDIYEVQVRSYINCVVEDKKVFIIEFMYSGIFVINGVNDELLQFCLFNECPRILFPFVRKIVYDLSYEGALGYLMVGYSDYMEKIHNNLAATANAQ